MARLADWLTHKYVGSWRDHRDPDQRIAENVQQFATHVMNLSRWTSDVAGLLGFLSRHSLGLRTSGDPARPWGVYMKRQRCLNWLEGAVQIQMKRLPNTQHLFF
jgi:hypothetical protein